MKLLRVQIRLPFLKSISKSAGIRILSQGWTVKIVVLSIQAGTVILVPALTDSYSYETPLDEIAFNAPTPVSRERFSETIDFPMYDAKHSITLRIPVPVLQRFTYASIE